MKTNFEKLNETKHMLEWLSENPYEKIISTITEIFTEQSPSTKILEFEITREPEWLSGGKKTDDGNNVILVRCGLSVPCNIKLQDNNGNYNLNGIFTWVGVNLDTQPKTNMWMDLDGTLEQYGKDGLLKSRIYELDN
ncbi:MAG: hypothetical protein ABIP95_10895 [Pelobium sp.]